MRTDTGASPVLSLGSTPATRVRMTPGPTARRLSDVVIESGDDVKNRMPPSVLYDVRPVVDPLPHPFFSPVHVGPVNCHHVGGCADEREHADKCRGIAKLGSEAAYWRKKFDVLNERYQAPYVSDDDD